MLYRFPRAYRGAFLWVMLVLPGLAFAQTQPSTLDTTVYNQGNTLLWRVSGAGLPSASYVFGTMHTLCPEDAVLPPELTTAFAQSQQLVLELELDAPGFAKQMRRAVQLPWPNSLRRVRRQRDYRVVRKFFKFRLHQPILPFVLMKPAFVEAYVYSTLLPCTPVGYEEKLMELAQAQHKELLGLETIQQQLASLDSIPYPRQMEALVKAIQAYDTYAPLMQQMVQVYRARNVDALYRFAVDPRYNPDQSEVADLAVRNQNWIPQMQALMRVRPTFFAVGAAHLGGRVGVLQRLRQQGYQVEPVLLSDSSATRQ
ncbi:TraB/GumN family protein [Hymenobacter sp. HSC-4F20]|uniref:TraB/GumN family protein n=1 Tax=Hymenobacter sp. HSC-4F20 TaxID=2864135 RepID=UPI001C73D235|nr:TraB/GumN family protein [Hymenobacter sp. HSC-4F20]MBX0291294.1 TraB/GumN family protein [Hymenobacter sp. HSC-4F20]